jgi:hypothetical protein
MSRKNTKLKKQTVAFSTQMNGISRRKQICYNSLSLYEMTSAEAAISVESDACYQLQHERESYEINVIRAGEKGSHGMRVRVYLGGGGASFR